MQASSTNSGWMTTVPAPTSAAMPMTVPEHTFADNTTTTPSVDASYNGFSVDSDRDQRLDLVSTQPKGEAANRCLPSYANSTSACRPRPGGFFFSRAARRWLIKSLPPIQATAMKDPSITWRRTFPDSAPGTDGVAIFEGRVIGRVRHMTNLPRDPNGRGASPTRSSPGGRAGPTRAAKCPRAGRPWTA